MPTRPRRILFLTSSADRYGSERALVELVSALRPGWELSVVVPGSGPLVGELEELGVTVTILPLRIISRGMARAEARETLRRVLRPDPALREYADHIKPSLIYSNTSHVVDGPALARAKRIPHVWHVREIERVPGWLRRVYGLYLAATGATIAISAPVRDAYGHRLLPGRMTVVQDGIDVNFYASGERYRAPERFNESRTLRALCAGRITRWKGQHVAVAAVRHLVAEGQPVSLRVVGDACTARDEAYLEELREAASGIQAITFLPGVDDIRPHLDWADVFVHVPIEAEPFGRAVVEAMAYPRAVIASAIGGPAHVLKGGAGQLIPSADDRALARVLEGFVQNPEELAQYAGSAGVRARSYDSATTAEAVGSILSRLTDGR